MIHRKRFVPAHQWLLPILAFLLVLGHACEVPAYADLVMSPHATEHAAHDQAHEAELSCDPIDVLASTGSVEVGPALGAAQAAPLDSPLPVRLVTASVEASKRPPGRPPLFLLHASLLI
jgi:hypothetical protein